MSKRWLVVLYWFAIATFALMAEAQEQGAGDAAHFLRDGLGARACGVGGAFVALADDVMASYWNPAGLPSVLGFRIGGAYENKFAGLGVSQCLASVYSGGSWGLGILWFNLEPYSVWFLSAATIWKNAQIGISGKLYRFASGLQSAEGLGFDFGALFRVPFEEEGFDLTLGLVSRDIGWSTIRWQGAGVDMIDHVAWVNRLGIALSSEGLFGPWSLMADLEFAFRRPPLAGEIDYISKSLQLRLDLGVEVWFQVVALRAGLAGIGFDEMGGPLIRPTLGVGVRVIRAEFDAAWTTSPLGSTYLLSAEFVF